MKKTLVIIFIISMLGFATRIKADVVADYALNMKINDDLSSQSDISIALQNNSDSSLISAYTIDFPFLVTNANATLDSTEVSTILSNSSGISTLKIDFGTTVIKPSQKANLKLSIFSLDSVKQAFYAKQLYLPFPSSNFNYSSVKVSIEYPILFGSITYSSEYKYSLERFDDNFSKVSFDQSSPILLMWGNPEFNISFKSTIINRKDSINHSLFNLVPEYNDQTVNYVQMFNADYGLRDKSGNNFAFLTVNANSSVNLNSGANLALKKIDDNAINTDKYNFSLNLDSIIGQKIYSQISQGNDNISKLKSLNDFIFQNFTYNSDKVTTQNFDGVWATDKKNLNPLEYCYLIVSTAEYLGLKADIEYGYNIFQSAESINPNIWCSVDADGKYLVFDFFNQKDIGYAQIANSSIDRVRMGIWHPSQGYNDILGLLTGNPVTANFAESTANLNNADLVPELKTDFPANVFSGEFYSGIINIVNPTSKILRFNSLMINQQSVLPNIQVGELEKVIMPLQQNSIKIDYLRETDFILNLSREIKVEAELDDHKLEDTIQVRFEPDYKLLALFVLILIVTISIFIYLLLKLLKRKV